ncbi:hypothetical protein Dimus_024342, partial [Dionaea muscipula]
MTVTHLKKKDVVKSKVRGVDLEFDHEKLATILGSGENRRRDDDEAAPEEEAEEEEERNKDDFDWEAVIDEATVEGESGSDDQFYDAQVGEEEPSDVNTNEDQASLASSSTSAEGTRAYRVDPSGPTSREVEFLKFRAELKGKGQTDMAPKVGSKRRPRVLVPPVEVPVPGEASTREDGEIPPPPHATKRPRSSVDSPPREVAATAQPPAQLKGFATRSEPGRVEKIVRSMEPSSSAGSKPLKKRITSLYSPSTPAVYYKYPSYTVTEPAPKIQNLPFPQRPLMTCEDNALAAFQAVSNATKHDTNFYVDQFGEYEKDWIDRDMRTSLARLMVATEASMRCRNRAQDRIFDKNREVQLAKSQRDYEKGEAEKYKT